MLKFEITKSDTAKIMKALRSRVRDLTPPLTGFSRYMIDQTRKQFDTETDPEGKPWHQLAPKTLKIKAKKGYSNKILTASGKMRRSLRFAVSSRELEITMDSPAPFHQQDDELSEKLPQRKILGLNSDRRAKLQQLIRVYVGGR